PSAPASCWRRPRGSSSRRTSSSSRRRPCCGWRAAACGTAGWTRRRGRSPRPPRARASWPSPAGGSSWPAAPSTPTSTPWPTSSERACELLETAARQLEQTTLQLLETQALLWLARCRLRDGRLDEASRALAEAAEGTRELAEPGWRLLMACDPVYADLHAMAH